jgi:hypothetical protein
MLVPVGFAVISTYQFALYPDYDPFSLWVIHKKDLPINRLMMMMLVLNWQSFSVVFRRPKERIAFFHVISNPDTQDVWKFCTGKTTRINWLKRLSAFEVHCYKTPIMLLHCKHACMHASGAHESFHSTCLFYLLPCCERNRVKCVYFRLLQDYSEYVLRCFGGFTWDYFIIPLNRIPRDSSAQRTILRVNLEERKT